VIGIVVSGGIANGNRRGAPSSENHRTGVAAGPIDVDIAPERPVATDAQ